MSYLAGQREVSHLLHMTDEGATDHDGRQTVGGRKTHIAALSDYAVMDTDVDGEGDDEVAAVEQNRRSRASLHGLKMVAYEHEDNIASIRDAMAHVQNGHPAAVREFKTQYATKLVLHKQEKCVKHMLHEGELIDLDAKPLLHTIDHNLGDLYKPHLSDLIRNDVSRVKHNAESVVNTIEQQTTRRSRERGILRTSTRKAKETKSKTSTTAPATKITTFASDLDMEA